MERTLSETEAKVVLDLEWRNQKTITLAELRQALEPYGITIADLPTGVRAAKPRRSPGSAA